MTCFNCEHARFCETWGELKCMKNKRRIYKVLGEDTCENFSKRKNGIILDTPCQCADCMEHRGEEEE